jgi:hypothetical protein
LSQIDKWFVVSLDSALLHRLRCFVHPSRTKREASAQTTVTLVAVLITTMVDEHYLQPFLQDRLPQLGLDPDTYSDYVMGLVDSEDEEEWDSVLELLQASSETHFDNDNVWKQLEADLRQMQAEHSEKVQQEQESLKQERLRQEQERLKQEIELAEEAKRRQEAAEKDESNIDDAKRALVERYAYDDSELYDENGNLVVSDTNEEQVLTNQEVAQQAMAERSQELKQKNPSSKKEEQQKTAKAKQDKAKLKEDRRSKAQKGERRR